MVVINQVLVVGIGMHGLDVAGANAVFVVCAFKTAMALVVQDAADRIVSSAAMS